MIKKGFTLIELLIYIAIVSILLLGLGGFAVSLLKIRTQAKAINLVEMQGIAAAQAITQQIRLSHSVSAPAAGNSAASLNLGGVQFDANSGRLRINSGSGWQNLTGNQVMVSNLQFINSTPTGALGNVRVTFTLTANNYQKDFYASASVR